MALRWRVPLPEAQELYVRLGRKCGLPGRVARDIHGTVLY